MTAPVPDPLRALRIAIAQLNCVVGDLEANAELIARLAADAAGQGADVMVTPELSLTGYPPEDLLLRPAFFTACDATLDALRQRLAPHVGLHVVVGHPVMEAGGCYNAASVLLEGKVLATYRKQALPNYNVFDERRYFTAGRDTVVFTVKGVCLGLNICEDTWYADAPAAARAAGAQVLLVPNASPFHANKLAQRQAVTRAHVCAAGMAVVYCNLVGGQDELVFDGGSYVQDSAGAISVQLSQFEEQLEIVNFDALSSAQPEPGVRAPVQDDVEQVYRALVLGTRDYVNKNRFPGVIIGLSGGVDSALTLALAVDALGADRVQAVMMPSLYTAEISWVDSRDMVARLGVRYDEIPIAPMFDAFRGALAPSFAGLAEDATEENIQARIRGTLLMALSNKSGRMVLTTGNKSEFATGYCTLYGDMAGGFAVIKDVVKTLVYRLCAWRNTSLAFGARDIIPERILTRAPSAELRPDQTDQDSLPPYEILDGIVRAYMEDGQPVAAIIAAGYPEAAVAQVVRLIQRNEYKRRQAPPGVRVTHRAFGRDWRYPITNRFKE